MTFLLLAGRCFYLQYLRSSEYSARWLSQRQRRITLKPQRGVILDSRGRVLAASNKSYTVFADPLIIKKPREVSNKLQGVLGMGAHEICKIITESRNPRFVKIKSGVGREQCSKAAEIYGIGLQSDWQRHYPMECLLSNIVGFTSADNRSSEGVPQGLEGLELQYDKELTGCAGRNVFLADSSRPYRRPVRLKERTSMLTNGSGLVLTIDASIQQFARDELLKQYESYEAESAVAIVVDPKSGAIWGMVSLPDFDPNDIRHTDPNNFRNRAITDTFEPGSVLKPVVAAIAVDAGAVGLSEKIFCENGEYRDPVKRIGRIGEYGDNRFGDLTVQEILVNSSNIGMAKIGQKLGKRKLYEGLRLFGFDKECGLDLPGEVPGQLRRVREWTSYSLTRIPFGQEILVTAIQLVRAFCILANGGRAVQPYLVKAMVDHNGDVVKLERAGPSVGYIIKEDVAKWIVTEALAGVVNEGTGEKAKLEKWQVFGKTGTAQMARSDGRGYDDHSYVASFAAGAPAEDPAVVVLVSIRKPNIRLGKGYTGGTVAAPVAGKILEKTLTYLEFHGS